MEIFGILVICAVIFIVSTVCSLCNLNESLSHIFSGIIICNMPFFSVEIIEILGNFGLLFILFKTGVETSLSTIINLKKSFFPALLSTLISSFFCFFVFKYIFLFNHPIVLGLCCGLSSTAIVTINLYDRHLIGTSIGLISLCSLILQDLFSIVEILVISLKTFSIFTFIKLGVGFILFIFLVYIVVCYIDNVLKKLFYISKNSAFIFLCLWILLFAYLSYSFGLSAELGALMAGICFSESSMKIEAENAINDIGHVLITCFFIFVGTNLNIMFFLNNFLNIMYIFSILTIVKLIGLILGTYYKLGKKSLIFALNMCNISEFGFVILREMNSRNLLINEEKELLYSVFLLSMIFSYFLTWISEKINKPDEPILIIKETHSIFIFGIDDKSIVLMDFFEQIGISYIGVDKCLNTVMEMKKKNRKVVLGNMFDEKFLNIVKFSDAKICFVSFTAKKIFEKDIQNLEKKYEQTEFILTTTTKREDNFWMQKGFRIIQETPYLFAKKAATKILLSLGQNTALIEEYFKNL